MQAPARTRLVRAVSSPLALDWDAHVHPLLAAPQGLVRVLGGPGTGKTTLMASVVARRILAGVDPERILVLTASRKSAEAMRTEITRQLTSLDEPVLDIHRTVREPMVRTVHSYAYAVLRRQAARFELPPPRLLSGAEQDVLIRELLAGDIEGGARDWPEKLGPALSVPGFAEELRDLIMRAAERGLGPDDLIKLGERKSRAEWIAAGKFWRQYEEVTLLQGAGGHGLGMPGSPALDAAELVASALVELDADPDLLTQEQDRIRHLFVDDAQHLDPLQFRLLRRLGSVATDFVVAGDPDQAIFSFRGADPALLTDADLDGKHTLVLNHSRRMSSAVHGAVSVLARNIAGPVLRRTLAPAQPDSASGPGKVLVRLWPTAAAEANWIADQLRRAHLMEEVPWSEMAVVVRSPTRSFPVLQRALRAAGVPISSTVEELPLIGQPAVRPLLTALRVAANSALLDAELAELLLASSLGGADPLALRRMRRGLRRLELAGGGNRASDELLVQVLHSGDGLAGLAPEESAPILKISRLLSSARALITQGAGVEQVLWDLWQQSKVQDRLIRLSERGGSLGVQADRDLDAIVALFDAAGNYVARLPKASVTGFVDYLSAQNIAGDSLAPVAARGEGISLITAHGAAGREWTVVAVAGVQEGSWPDLRLRGSLLGVERLVDILSGVDVDTVSLTAPILAEERRLFYVAASRAKRTLLVSAVSGEDEQPSRFLDDLADRDEIGGLPSIMPVKSAERSLTLAELVGELRRVACDGSVKQQRRQLAAQQLAKLAAAGVSGAHPDSWYGVAEESTRDSLHPAGEVIKISPSTVDILARCPLRWLIERHGGSDPAQLAAVTGTLVHELAQAAASGYDDEQLRQALDEAWMRVDAGAPWFSRRERRRVEHMVKNFVTWLEQSRSELTEVGIEQDIEVELPAGEDGIRVRLRGRVDRLETDDQGRPVIIDIKTSKVPVSAADAELHPQLAAYQLAVLLGAFEKGTTPGGAKLVYVAKANIKTGATQRVQAPLDEQNGKQWLELVHRVAKSATGPEYQATENPDCDRCPARGSCPIRPEGRQVTSG